MMLLRIVLLHSILLLLIATHSFAASSHKRGVDQASVAHLPYQYFLSDGVGGSKAVCWLSRIPFPVIEGVTCHFADTISQVKGRQIWQCEGDQAKFCDGCHELEKHLVDPKDSVQWKLQGC